MVTIRAAKDFQELEPLVEIEKSIVEKQKLDVDIAERFVWFKCLFEQKQFIEKFEFKVFLFEDEEGLCGYTICHLMKSPLKAFNEIYIYRAWHNHKNKGLDKMFFAQLNDWAKENGMTKVAIRSDSESRIRAQQRKYGLIPISTHLEKVMEVI